MTTISSTDSEPVFPAATVGGLTVLDTTYAASAMTAGLALIPLAVGGGEPGNELQTPMAIVILGGLLSATALNMVVLPALYWLYGDRVIAAHDETSLAGASRGER